MTDQQNNEDRLDALEEAANNRSARVWDVNTVKLDKLAAMFDAGWEFVCVIPRVSNLETQKFLVRKKI